MRNKVAMFRPPNRSPNRPSEEILIVGAGIAGLSLARGLKAKNIKFKIIEKRPGLWAEGAGIALPANAVQALRHIGLGDEIERHAHRVNKIIYTDTAGNLLSEASLLEPPLNVDKFVALHRSKFHEILRDGIEENITFNTQIEQLHPTKDGIIVKFTNPNLPPKKFAAVIGADGLHSQVRKLAFSDKPLVDFGVTTWRWTCQYPTNNLQPTYMLGAHNVFMAYPIGKNEVYCYAHTSDPENLYLKTADHSAMLLQIFGQYGGVAKEMLRILPDDQYIICGRIRSVPQPLFVRGRFVLIGDAGHGCTATLQQGAGAAAEDAAVLAALIDYFSIERIEDALASYEKFRRERVNESVRLSDGPMKMIINIDSQLLLLYQKIRDEGPLNVQGWRKLLRHNPINDMMHYLKARQLLDEEESLFVMISKF
jgi:2-polyprenyl-6-methoxyphenol hydroxylase-like FAD-dependent oxidoreductase